MNKNIKWSLLVFVFLFSCVLFLSVASGEASGWTIENGRLYYYKNGVKVTGEVRINQVFYSFADDGHLKSTGKVLLIGDRYNDPRYVYVKSNGRLASEWTKVGAYTYYFDPQTYYAVRGVNKINQKSYLFDTDGKWMNTPGWPPINEPYYVLADGSLDLRPGYRKVEGHWYYFDEDGRSISGLIKINGKYHFFYNGPDAPVQGGHPERRGWVTGWMWPFVRYFDPKTGEMVTEDRVIDGVQYHFYDDGVLKIQNDIAYIKGYIRGFDYNSHVITDGSVVASDGKTYTFIHGSLALNKGWTKILGRWFYSYEYGTDFVGWLYEDDHTYYIKHGGEMVTGWARINDKLFYFASDGHLVSGWVQNHGKWYYYLSDGSMYTGWLLDDGAWYYMQSDGAMATGWVKVGNTSYYMTSSGAMATGWKQVNGKWYYFKPNGAMVIGWLKEGDNWYYMQSDGAMATGWVKEGNTSYYMTSSGAMATGWKQVNGKWYYFKPNGAMAIGWLKEGDNWYYMQSDGAMATGWINDGGIRYYLKSDGAMATGWKKISGNWYYFLDSGAMKRGWFKDKDESWYWFDKDGVMVVGTQTIDGKEEVFSSDGAWMYTVQ